MIAYQLYAIQQKLSRLLAANGRGALVEHRSIAFISIVALVLIVYIAVLARGFTSVSVDDHMRVLDAAIWVLKPSIFPAEGDWLPGYNLIVGSALKIHYDLFIIPHLLIFLFSFMTLFMLYLLTKNLFNAQAALLSMFIVGLLPFYVHLSLTPLSDMVYFLLVVSFLYFCLRWYDSCRDSLLLLSASLLTMATTVRYEGWLLAALFCLYLGLRWLSAVRSTRVLHPLWLLSMAMVCLFPCVWMLRHYLLSGHPLLFMESTFPGEPDTSGLLTSLSPKLAYVELLLQNGSLICLLATGGLLLLRRDLTHKLWLYLILSLTPLILLTLFMKPPAFWAAYRPRYSGLFVILLTPICAYTLYWAMTAPTRPVKYGWQTARMALPAVLAVYNLWLIYLRMEGQSAVLIFFLAFGGVMLAYYLPDRYGSILFVLSILPFLLIVFLFNSLLSISVSKTYLFFYFISLFTFYSCYIYKHRKIHNYTCANHWRMIGIILLSSISVFNLFNNLRDVPKLCSSAIKTGWQIRKIFYDGMLLDSDKILLEVSGHDYLCMQVASNHPANFVFDRPPKDDYRSDSKKSFLFDSSIPIVEIDDALNMYSVRVNNGDLQYSSVFYDVLLRKRIRLLIVKDLELISLLNNYNYLKPIEKIHDYVFYSVIMGSKAKGDGV